MTLPQEKRYTYADLLDWPEDERVELIDGVVYRINAPGRKHQRIGGALFAQFFNYLVGKTCEVYYAPYEVRLFAKKGDSLRSVDTMVEPDLIVVCDQDKLDDNCCFGAPDLVIEILSPSSMRNDRLLKFSLYQRAGVKEYWIVDPEAKVVQVMTLEDGQYYAPLVYTARDTIPVGVLEDCVIDLGPVFAGL